MVSLNSFLLGVADVSNSFVAPKGMWESLITGIYGFAKTYGVTIILLTLFIKLAMTPMDFWQKYTQKKTSLQQESMKPELAAIQKRYAYDKNILNQKTMEVYKKHGVSPMGSCLSMLVNLGVMLAVFITLINAINGMSPYYMRNQYGALSKIYIEAEGTVRDAGFFYADDKAPLFTILTLDEYNELTAEEKETYDAAKAEYETALANWQQRFVYNATLDAFVANAEFDALEQSEITEILDFLPDAGYDAFDAETIAALEGQAKTDYEEYIAAKTLNANYTAYVAAKALFEPYEVLRSSYESEVAEIEEATKDAILKAWKNDKAVREKFLWIQNIWRKDTKQSVIPSYAEIDAKYYVSGNKDYFESKANIAAHMSAKDFRVLENSAIWSLDDGKYTGPKLKKIAKESDDYDLVIESVFYSKVSKADYETVMAPLMAKYQGKNNGLYLLTVFAVLTSILSIWLMQKKNGGANPMAANPNQKSGKMMMFIMPIIIGVFTLSASSTFAIYLVFSQILSILTTLALDPFVKKLVTKNQDKKKNGSGSGNSQKPKINYSR